MKNIIFINLLLVLLISCNLEEQKHISSLSNIQYKQNDKSGYKKEYINPLIGIQYKKNDNEFTYKKEFYDFSEKWEPVLETFKVFVKYSNGEKKETSSVMVFSISEESGWFFGKEDKKVPNKGFVLFIDEIYKNNFNNFEKAIKNGGDFKAVRMRPEGDDTFDIKNEDTEEKVRTKVNSETDTITIKKEPGEDNYIFFNIKIHTGEKYDDGKPKYKDVSFAINKKDIENKFKKAKEKPREITMINQFKEEEENKEE